jgi:hypothetical protein
LADLSQGVIHEQINPGKGIICKGGPSWIIRAADNPFRQLADLSQGVIHEQINPGEGIICKGEPSWIICAADNPTYSVNFGITFAETFQWSCF